MTASGMSEQDSDYLKAGAELVQRTGASQFMVRYSDEEKPVVWMALAGYDNPKGNAARGTNVHWEVGASLHPIQAVLRLLDQLMDGGKCKHCDRPTGVTSDFDEMPLDDLFCWYQYDPELKKFRRGCEGGRDDD